MLLSASFPFTIIDDIFREVEISPNPQRIVVAAPSITDFIVKLGEESRIVGVTDWDTFDAERIGQLTPLNIEKIVSLDPDIVFLTGGFQAPEAFKLEEFGITAVVVNPNKIDEVLRTATLISLILGVKSKGEALVSEYRKRVDKVAIEKVYPIPLAERKKIFFAMISESEIKDLWTCAAGSFLNEIFTLAGGINITGAFSGPNGWIPVGIEFVALENPDVIFVPYYYEGGETPAVEAIKNFRPWSGVKAVENGFIIGIEGNAASQPNLMLVDLLEDIYSKLYENGK